MNHWIILWKIIFILSLGLFAYLAVWVTIGGYRDIKQLFSTLNKKAK